MTALELVAMAAVAIMVLAVVILAAAAGRLFFIFEYTGDRRRQHAGRLCFWTALILQALAFYLWGKI